MGALDLYQIKHLYFPSIRTARRRMEILAKKKGVNRVRPSIDLPYHYWVGRKPGQLEHRIGTNYARLYLDEGLKSWETKHSWEYEPQYYDILRPDGFMAIKNTTTNKLKCLFVEFDRCFDPFDKVQKYNELYANGGFVGAWWAKLVDRFPAILVVSEDVGRAQKQLKNNKHNLEFRFVDYRQIRGQFSC
jgi:hypothetical protein